MMRSAVSVVVSVMLSFAALPAMAQDKASGKSSSEWLALIQADRRAVVAGAMELNEEQAKKFWPLYDDFQRAMAVPRAALSRAQNDFIAAGPSVTDANARRLAQDVLAAEKEEARLRDKHFRKMLAALPPKQAARYMQVERKIEAVVRYESAKVIPLAR
jgi:Spy/CpxP family protein refolding chaperone